MRIKFKGPVAGQPFGVSSGGKSASVTKWGVGAPFAFPGAIARSALNARMNVLTLPDADAIAITSGPSAGRITVRSDKKLSLDLTEYLGTDPVTFGYRATKAGADPVDGICTVTISENTQFSWDGDIKAFTDKPRWWGKGRHYVLPVDENNRYLVERHPTSKTFHFAADGLTAAQIAALKGVSEATVTALWLVNPANTVPGETFRFGETPEYPLSPVFLSGISDRELGKSPWMLFRRGDIFNVAPSKLAGLSRRFPAYVGAYGTGPDPVFTVVPMINARQNVVVQDIAFATVDGGYFDLVLNSEFVIADGIRCNRAGLSMQGPGAFSRGITLRRIWQVDSYRDVSRGSEVLNGVTIWNMRANRIQGLYLSSLDGGLLEDVFVDKSGWNDGYAYDQRLEAPQPPSMYSHNIYCNGSSADLTVRRTICSRGALTGFQWRAGGVMEDLVSFGSNVGVLVGGNTSDGNTLGGPFAWVSNVLITEAGQRKTSDADFVLGRGIDANCPWGAYDRIAIVHSNAGTPLAEFGPSGQSIGPTEGRALNVTSEVVAYSVNAAIYNWLPASLGLSGNSPDQLLPGANEALAAGRTIGAWLDQKIGVTGSDFTDVAEHFRTLDEPWTEIRALHNWMMPAYGFAAITDRMVPTTLVFRPDDQGRTPGMRADIRADWSTGDLPGTAAGDSIDLDGHRVNWSMNPANEIADLDFGGGELTMWGGTLKPTGIVWGGGRLVLDYVSDFWCDGFTSSDLWNVVVQGEGRFVNTGAFSGACNMTVRSQAQAVLAHDAASFTVTAGRVLQIDGGAAVGFDGVANGAASITIAAGATLKLRPGMVLPFAGRQIPSPSIWESARVTFRIGSTVTGLTSGATATVLDVLNDTLVNGRLVLGDITGSFVAGETLNGAAICAWKELPAQNIATVTAATPIKLVPKIGKLATGPGTGAVTPTFTCGGTLDLTGLPAGTHTVIEADTITGAFADVIGGTVSYATPGKVIATVA